MNVHKKNKKFMTRTGYITVMDLLDSLRVELLSGNLDTPNEYLKANYIPKGLNLIGDKTQSLLFTSQNKISTTEIEKILDGIVYINELKDPSPGVRLIRPVFIFRGMMTLCIPGFQFLFLKNFNPIPQFGFVRMGSSIPLINLFHPWLH